MSRRIYTASSWKNEFYPEIVSTLRHWGHLVHDFRDPTMNHVFQWSQVDPDWAEWDLNSYIVALMNDNSNKGFQSDKGGLDWCDTCLLILPCGRSAHFEIGYACGQKKQGIIYIPPNLPRDKNIGWEPELMYKFCDRKNGRPGIYSDMYELREALKEVLD